MGVEKVKQGLPRDMRNVWAEADDAHRDRMAAARERKARSRDGASAQPELTA